MAETTAPQNTENPKGLSSKEAQERLEQFGPNAISEKEESWLHRLFRRFRGPIPWMIEVAAILSAAAKRWEDFTIIVILLLVNAHGVGMYLDPATTDQSHGLCQPPG